LDQAAIGLGGDLPVMFMRDTLPLDRSSHDLWRVVRALGTFDSLLISLILSGTITLPLSVRIGANLVAQIESTIVAVSPFLTHVPVVVLGASAVLRRIVVRRVVVAHRPRNKEGRPPRAERVDAG
jgi:hypothetical protein